MTRTHTIIGACLLAGLAAIAAWLFMTSSADPVVGGQAAAPVADPMMMDAAAAARMGINLAPAQLAATLPIGEVAGTVTLPPSARAAVGAPFPGMLRQLFVLPGQYVRRGDVLAIMVSPDALRIGADLNRAQARVSVARASAARIDQLSREGIVAAARADEARAIAREAEASVGEHTRILAISGAGGNGVIHLRAPISGRVASIAVQPGGPVDTMTAPMIIEATDQLQLEIQLPQHLIGRVTPGMGILLADGIRGRIVSVGATLDPVTRSIPVRATLIAAAGLVPGQSVMANIEGAASERAGVSVPDSAMARIGNHDVVFVHDGRRMAVRRVTVAGHAGGRTYVSAGLTVNQRVATSGVAELKAAAGQ